LAEPIACADAGIPLGAESVPDVACGLLGEGWRSVSRRAPRAGSRSCNYVSHLRGRHAELSPHSRTPWTRLRADFADVGKRRGGRSIAFQRFNGRHCIAPSSRCWPSIQVSLPRAAGAALRGVGARPLSEHPKRCRIVRQYFSAVVESADSGGPQAITRRRAESGNTERRFHRSGGALRLRRCAMSTSIAHSSPGKHRGGSTTLDHDHDPGVTQGSTRHTRL